MMRWAELAQKALEDLAEIRRLLTELLAAHKDRV